MENLEDLKKYIVQEFELDEEDTQEIVDDYFELIDKSLKELEEEKNINHHLHTLKGASANMGANSLANFCSNWEKEVKENISYDIIEKIKELKKIVSSFK